MPDVLRPRHGHLLAELPAAAADEHFEPLFATRGLRIERIVSHGQASPPGFWYDQAEDEWVMVVAGRASVEFVDGAAITLDSGAWLAIPAHCRHRVAATAVPTVWLAVHGLAEPAA